MSATKQLAQYVDYAYVRGHELAVGNRVHIYKFMGTYEITSLTRTHFEIDCKTWKVQNKKPLWLPLEQFKCFYGEYSTSKANH